MRVTGDQILVRITELPGDGRAIGRVIRRGKGVREYPVRTPRGWTVRRTYVELPPRGALVAFPLSLLKYRVSSRRGDDRYVVLYADDVRTIARPTEVAA